MDLGLQGKVAIVTGGSFGIGKAAAASLSAEGARVAIAARNQADLDAAAQEIEASTGNPVMGISTDIRDEVQVQDLVDRVVGEWGGVDILVNNAGTSAAHSFSDLTDEIFTEDFRLKVYGAMYCIRAALPHMKKVWLAGRFSTSRPRAAKLPPGERTQRPWRERPVSP